MIFAICPPDATKMTFDLTMDEIDYIAGCDGNADFSEWPIERLASAYARLTYAEGHAKNAGEFDLYHKIHWARCVIHDYCRDHRGPDDLFYALCDHGDYYD